MRYPLFEFLALVVGSVAILASVLFTHSSGAFVEEAVAQSLLLVVLVGALHKGRKGGTVTAVIATVIYLAMRVPMIARLGLTPDVISLLASRTLTYLLIGVGGGMLASRVQYFLARFESSTGVDSASQLFNQRFIARTLRTMIGQHERFRTTFTVVTVVLTGAAKAEPRPGRRSAPRIVGGYIRDHVRLIDDVARLDDGRFVIVLPQTDRAGGQVVAARIGSGVRRLLSVPEQAVAVEVLSPEANLGALRELCGLPAAAGGSPEPDRAVA